MTFAPWASRLTAPLALLALSGALLVGCGGGTSQVDQFKPTRLLNFGDELSVLTADGKKYSVNALDKDDALSCGGNPLWIQTVAARYGFTFEQCNPDKKTVFLAKSLATVGAGVNEVLAQIDTFQASNSFTDTDLLTVFVGFNDIKAAYAKYPAKSEAELTAEVKAKGEALALRVNALTALGPRVLVSTAMHISGSPWALAEKAAHADTDRAALLTRLTEAFNLAMRLKLINDGSKIGLLLADDLSRAMSSERTRSAYGLANSTVAACSTALPDCTTKTMVSNATASVYLWADDTRPGASFHSYLAQQASNRLSALPF
ncbi:MAG: esterase [Ideonella sp. MAG2]|nr:MAG: esterase [Ideonella sp. MAG2]